jgi:hypothetical protein
MRQERLSHLPPALSHLSLAPWADHYDGGVRRFDLIIGADQLHLVQGDTHRVPGAPSVVDTMFGPILLGPLGSSRGTPNPILSPALFVVEPEPDIQALWALESIGIKPEEALTPTFPPPNVRPRTRPATACDCHSWATDDRRATSAARPVNTELLSSGSVTSSYANTRRRWTSCASRTSSRTPRREHPMDFSSPITGRGRRASFESCSTTPLWIPPEHPSTAALTQVRISVPPAWTFARSPPPRSS